MAAVKSYVPRLRGSLFVKLQIAEVHAVMEEEARLCGRQPRAEERRGKKGAKSSHQRPVKSESEKLLREVEKQLKREFGFDRERILRHPERFSPLSGVAAAASPKPAGSPASARGGPAASPGALANDCFCGLGANLELDRVVH